jgi:hypothetical protein
MTLVMTDRNPQEPVRIACYRRNSNRLAPEYETSMNPTR